VGTRRPPDAPATWRPGAAAVAVTRRILLGGGPAALVLWVAIFDQAAEPYATSQASGMLSVSLVPPMPTAMSASAGPVTRWSSTRLEASAMLT